MATHVEPKTMRSSANDITDLQIFLSRAPGSSSESDDKYPTILLAGSYEFSSDQSESGISSRTSGEKLPQYIAIANSETVESITIPFSQQYIESFLARLSQDRVGLRECIDFGTALFDSLFHRTIRDRFRALNVNGKGLRLTIASAAPELLVLPWELLCDTQFGLLPEFLCYQPKLRLCRSLRLFNRADFAEVPLSDGMVRILLVTAAPASLGPLDIEKEEQMLQFVLDDVPEIEDVELLVLHGATVRSLREALSLHQPNIVHVACHGAYDPRAGMGFVALCSDKNDKEADVVSSFRFATLLREASSVRLVFVNSCYGAAQDPLSPFSGVAECIHAAGVPAVVALQFALLDTTAHAIALNFYRFLLREKLTVENCVTRIRQYLFLNNHMFGECFGLALFQGNGTVSWQHGDPEPVISGSVDRFAELVSAFESQMQQKALIEKLSTELDRFSAQLVDLESVSPSDLLLAVNVFGDKLAPIVLRHIRNSSVSISVFLKLAKLASLLCHTPHEHKELVTAFLVYSPFDPDEYFKESEGNISEVLDHGFYMGEIKKVLGEAIKVDGVERVFVALSRNEGSNFTHEYIQNLPKADKDHDDNNILLGDGKWKRIYLATAKFGCALVIVGGSKMKLIASGGQVAEYHHGEWKESRMEELKKSIAELAAKTSLDPRILTDIVQKSLSASEWGKGRTFVICLKDGPEPKLEGHYKNVGSIEGANDLKARKIYDFEAIAYLNIVEGDGAVVIAADGQTLAVNAKLASDPKTQVDPIPGAGSRHLSAQKTTKESNTVAVVVSEDGPVTIFYQGGVVFRKT